MRGDEHKVFKSFGCQYDQKDIGIKPSIKRVSIADAKANVIFDISEDKKKKNHRSKNQEKEKSRNKDKYKHNPNKSKDKSKNN